VENADNNQNEMMTPPELTHRCRGCGRPADATRRCADCVHADGELRRGFLRMKVGELGLVDLVQSIDGKYYANRGGTLRRVLVGPDPIEELAKKKVSSTDEPTTPDGTLPAGEEPSE